MGRTPDRRPGSLDEEEILLETNPGSPSSTGGMRYNGAAFVMRDALGDFNPRTGGASAPTIYHDEDEGEFETTSETPVNASSFTFTVPDGDYLLTWSLELRSSAAVSRVRARVDVDASEINEVISGVSFQDQGRAIYDARSGHERIAVTGGSVVVDFSISRAGNSGSVFVRRRRASIIPAVFL